MRSYLDQMQQFCFALQNEICYSFSELNQKSFRHDEWERAGGGGGRSCVFDGGDVFEKAGVNVSLVHGDLYGEEKLFFEGLLRQQDRETSLDDGQSFSATGISLVCHPHNPFVPIVHMNIRYFELKGLGLFWFGGGADLTPHYLNLDDAIYFHQTYKSVCDQYEAFDYAEFKAWADRYFYIPHRQEHRGIGGVFFDYLYESGQTFSFVQATANAFLKAYMPLIRGHYQDPFNQTERDWQLLRRGRYVEFNLMYDRGTVFGLKTGGRVESILMSLSPLARWGYDVQVAPGSPEFEMQEVLKKPRDYI